MSESDSDAFEMPHRIEVEALLKLPAELQMVPPTPYNLMPGWFICPFASSLIRMN